ncbi:hypothetical protein MMC20_005241 [Loxospora ochrophaea]|nr:hypothetical protein [Loxospora ochrophaea]
MKLLSITTTLFACITLVLALSIPDFNDGRFRRDLSGYLEKRRGGGGKSGGSSGSSSGSSSSSSSGSSGSSGAKGSSGVTSSSSSARPAYGGGKYYGGGATTAYAAGRSSPLGIAPYFIGGAALGFFPGLWLYGAYGYNYNHPVSYHNSSAHNATNETLPVTCLCQQYSACGCDDNGNTTYIDSLLGNGSAADENSTLVRVGVVNGTQTVIINGTLPNGTDSTSAAGPSLRQTALESSGFWLVGAIVASMVWLL